MFYLAGEVWRAELAARGVRYTPYMYANRLFNRAWHSLQAPVEEHLGSYVAGRVNVDQAYRGLIAALPPP